MRNLLRYLGVGKSEQDDSGSKVITAADRVRLADERAQALEQVSQAEETSEPVPARERSLTAPPERSPPVPARSVEEPPAPRPEQGGAPQRKVPLRV